ncbi:MAG: sigma-54-dependent Fis family transcriptional regulator [Planctomycetes bacterium]|nr:sigma-54-dependent Fis family transcriptional regulator [Planctomycetota bacterium]
MKPTRAPTILIVEDEVNLGRVLAGLLEQAGYRAIVVGRAEEALPRLADPELGLVLTDLRLPGLDGLELLARAARTRPELPVILMTAYGTIQTAVAAMKGGAGDFLVKPVDREALLFAVGKALRGAARTLPTAAGEPVFLGRDPRMQAVTALIAKVAPSPATVLITGESGTGKELVARALHAQSPRRAGPLVKVNCAALPETLLESELFGYEAGAFTGATHAKPGRFELAQGGTILLDEIGELSNATQAKLLRVLQEREFERLGGVGTQRADVRVVAATNCDLRRAVAAGRFREDLYFRVQVVEIALPPLRERIGDVPELALGFLARFAAANGRGPMTLSAAALGRLVAWHWPGNVRELEHAIERAVVLAGGAAIDPADLPPEIAAGGGRAAPAVAPAAAAPADLPAAAATGMKEILAHATGALERTLIERALEESGQNRTHAAARLGISRRALQKKLKEYGL